MDTGESSTYNPAKELQVPQYDIEIWKWQSYGGMYVADISNIIVGGLNITWKLNDAESLDFNVDLIQLENKCKLMGVTVDQILKPYVHDIRIKRNGRYIIGCQVVETNIDIPNNSPVIIQVRCTGFLNLFKDRYLTVPIWCDKSTKREDSTESINTFKTLAYSTPAYVAGKLIELSQAYPAPIGIVKNPTGDIDRDGWVAVNGYITTGSANVPHSGNGYIEVNRDGEGWVTAATRLYVTKGTQVHCSVWIRAEYGKTLQVAQRQYFNQYDNQKVGISDISVYDPNGNYIGSYASSSAPLYYGYYRYEFDVTTNWDTTYLLFEFWRGTSAWALCIDDLFVSYPTESGRRRNFYVNAVYPIDIESTRKVSLKRNYQLQNVKDALLELTEIDTDAIEFYFDADRTIHIGYFGFVGDEKYDLQICYPGNIDSMTISRSASNLYNSILNIGSGIGNERVEAQALNPSSMSTYGCRESVVTSNNASEYSRLQEEAYGELYKSAIPTDLPHVVIRDGSINPNNLQIGDKINIYINNNDAYLATVTGSYRVIEYQLTVDQNNSETVALTLEEW